MSITTQQQADAASDSYVNRSNRDVENNTGVLLGGRNFTVFGYKSDSITGFHATAYQNNATGQIVIAYRGTDPGLFAGEAKTHGLTSVQDIAVDATMVRDRINPQKSAADQFTAEMIAKAERRGISRDQITVAGHSLGGALAELEAAEFGLRGATFNAYGAVDLGYGVSEGGNRVTNYVLAGDVVSAASHHYGRVVTLASAEDVTSLREGRYLDTLAGARSPNPLLAMRLADHSVTHFTGADSVLTPGTLAQYEQNYVAHKAAIDAYRGDIHRERGELAVALYQAEGRDAQAQLPADVQRQLDEYLAVNVDPGIQSSIERNAAVTGIEGGLQGTAAMVRSSGQFIQAQDERLATAARAVGDEVPLLDPSTRLASAAVGEAAHVDGRGVRFVSERAADLLHSAERAVAREAHGLAHAVEATIHNSRLQAGVLEVLDGVVNANRSLEAAGHAAAKKYKDARHTLSHDVHAGENALRRGADATEHAISRGVDEAERSVSHGITAAEHAVSRGVNATEHAVANGIGATKHAAEHVYDSVMGKLHGSGDRSQSAASPFIGVDPRNPVSPDHRLYEALHRRVPDASADRLMQFTAACHTHGINDKNLDAIHLNEKSMSLIFVPSGFTGSVAHVDLKEPPPSPAQSMQHIQQYDHQQAQLNQRIRQDMAQQQGMQGPVPGMPMH